MSAPQEFYPEAGTTLTTRIPWTSDDGQHTIESGTRCTVEEVYGSFGLLTVRCPLPNGESFVEEFPNIDLGYFFTGEG